MQIWIFITIPSKKNSFGTWSTPHTNGVGGWRPDLLCRSGYFISFLVKDWEIDPYPPAHPKGWASMPDLCVQIWIFHGIPSKKLFWYLMSTPYHYPHGDSGWKHDIFVHIWRSQLITSKRIFFNFDPNSMPRELGSIHDLSVQILRIHTICSKNIFGHFKPRIHPTPKEVRGLNMMCIYGHFILFLAKDISLEIAPSSPFTPVELGSKHDFSLKIWIFYGTHQKHILVLDPTPLTPQGRKHDFWAEKMFLLKMTPHLFPCNKALRWGPNNKVQGLWKVQQQGPRGFAKPIVKPLEASWSSVAKLP